MARLEGFEPPTPSFVAKYSKSTELQAHNLVVIVGNDPTYEAYETPAYTSMLYHHIETHYTSTASNVVY